MHMNASVHSAPLRFQAALLHCTALRHAARSIGHGRRARGELVQHALLVGLGVQPRRHGEERVEAQQHLREYSEYQRPPSHPPALPTQNKVPAAVTKAAAAALPREVSRSFR